MPQAKPAALWTLHRRGRKDDEVFGYWAGIAMLLLGARTEYLLQSCTSDLEHFEQSGPCSCAILRSGKRVEVQYIHVGLPEKVQARKGRERASQDVHAGKLVPLRELHMANGSA